MNIVPNEVHFSGYPTDHLIGVLPDEQDMQRLMSSLDASELPTQTVKVFVGATGAQQFGGEHHGLRSWLGDLTRTLTGTSEGRLSYMDALDSGHVVVAVDLRDRSAQKQTVAALFKAAGARDINFLGSLMVETLD
jgi:hypothetical protein